MRPCWPISALKTTGIVTALRLGGSVGFFMQSAAGDEDADLATSEGLFVYMGSATQLPAVGDRVDVTGSVKEGTAT